MHHLIRFLAGVITGIVGMKLIRSKSGQEALEKAQDKLRTATASTVQAVKNVTERARAQDTADTEKTKKPPKKSGSRRHTNKPQHTDSDKE